MYTEYIYENKEYEVALRNIKSILFDLDLITQDKMNAVINKIESIDDEELQNQLATIYNSYLEERQRMLDAGTLLEEIIQLEDSYSKECKKVTNKQISNIVSSKQNDSEVERGKNPVVTEEERQLEEINKQQEAIKEEQATLQAEEEAAKKIIEEAQQESSETNENESEEETDEPEETEEETDESSSDSDEEDEDEESDEDETDDSDSEEDDETNQSSDEPIIQSVEIVGNNEEETETSDEETSEETDETEEKTEEKEELSPEEEKQKTIDLANSLGINLPDNMDSGVIKFKSSYQPKEDLLKTDTEQSSEEQEENKDSNAIDLNSNPDEIETMDDDEDDDDEETDEPEEDEDETEDALNQPVIPEETDETQGETSPVIPQINPESTQSENNESPTSTDNSDSPSSNTVMPTVNETITEKQSSEEEPMLKFIKYDDDDDARAILTSASQISKLRASRFSQEAILRTKGILSSTESTEVVIPTTGTEEQSTDTNQPVIAIPQASTDSVVIPTVGDSSTQSNEQVVPQIQVQTISSDSIESQPTENGTQTTDIDSLQNEINQKMEQAKQLYDAGQTQEAQVLYDQISDLSKKLQEQQQ